MNMPVKMFETPMPFPRAETAASRVFRDGDAVGQAAHAREDGTIAFQHRDSRTVFQRMRSLWHPYRQKSELNEARRDTEAAAEPDWPRHWAIARYL